MLNTLRIAPLNIAPYASNRMGLLPYADYGNFMGASSQEAMPSQKVKPANQQLLPPVNATKLKADVFTSRVASTTQPTATAKGSRVDATTYSGSNRSSNVALKPTALQANKLNFMA
ncbi:MAG: hypothetical protein NTW61_03845 [Candidatus Melainabacteria bacterium]|nr:hypothetical protein [Candidatus Melainabacteria bacterium]